MADDDQPDRSSFEAGEGERGSDDAESPSDAERSRGDAESSSDAERSTGDTGRPSDAGRSPGEDGATTGDVADPPDAESVRPVSELDRSERVELGVDLLAHVERESLSLSAAVDRIESVTTNPALTREILDTAELRGVIEREEGRLRTRRGGTFVRFERQVVEREGDYECRRCGAGLSTGHFVRFESGELGPFGPSCVRKILGRE